MVVSYLKGGMQTKDIWKQDPEANIWEWKVEKAPKWGVLYRETNMQAKGIQKQDPEANIWVQEGWEWGVEKAPQWGTS